MIKLIKVNLGCGSTGLDDWVNIDNSLNAKLAKRPLLRLLFHKIGILPKNLYDVPWENLNIKIHDVRKKLPFEDNSVDYIYSSHLIEHLNIEEAKTLLKECKRILKEDGIIRIVTPDLNKLVKNYLIEYDNKDLEKVAADNFLSSLGLIRNKQPWYTKYFYAPHKFLFDDKSLKKVLLSAGFTKIKNRKFKEGNVPDIKLLDNRSSESIYIEAQKPSQEYD